MVGRRRKMLKLHWLKCPKAVPKKFGSENEWLKTSYLELMYYFQITKLTKTSKKGQSFCNPVSLKNPHSSYEPQLNQHYKKFNPETQPKTCF